MDDVPITNLVKGLQAGDPGAAAQLFNHYAQRLTRLAEQHLSHKLAGRVDGEDVVQSAFRTFFRRSAAGQFTIDGSGQLWRLLVKITLLKARARGRHHTAAMRNVGAEASGDAWLAEAAAREPGPDEAAAVVDLIDRVLLGLPPVFGEVLERRLQGEKVSAIARQMRLSRQSVYRMLDLLKQRLLASTAGRG